MPLGYLELDNAAFVNREVDRAELQCGQCSLYCIECIFRNRPCVFALFGIV